MKLGDDSLMIVGCRLTLGTNILYDSFAVCIVEPKRMRTGVPPTNLVEII